MIVLFSFLQLTITFIYIWINTWSLGYLGVYFLVMFNLLISTFLIWWDVYLIWLNSTFFEYILFFWAELGNNVHIYVQFKSDFFGTLLSFVMVSGALFVITFVFIDMWDDKEGCSFLVNLGFFLIFMLIVANSSNLIFFYLGWEGIAFTSLFLINFWCDRVRGIKASFKVFVINKIGDFFFLLLISLLINLIGDVDFDTINISTVFLLNYKYRIGSFNIPCVEVLGIILVLSGCVKSSQYGFHIWLLEAMEAPLGASALMHSSTLVVAGLVLIFRLNSILELSGWAQILMYVLGIVSATMGSLIACFQFELKVIMAYSTISNMGYMFMLCAVGAYFEMFIIMIIHAYIKIFLFLVVGGIMLHCGGCQDLRWMGGLFLYIPTLAVSYLIGGICLIGLPYWSGYYCKFYIWYAITDSSILLRGGEYFLLVSYILTFFYVCRTGYLVFLGPKNGHRRIYINKPTSLLYIYDLLLLGIIILFMGTFWVNLVDSNYSYLTGSLYYKSFTFFQYINYELSYLSLYLWVIVYLIITIFFTFWLVFSLNFTWNIFKYWFYITLFLNILFLIIF
uniref:NADH dehydrogenase subunit 5 n=1 Tax=Gruberia lanceolata TaxID=1978530 RepID=A0A6C0UA97_9CILI|nr:NADH dehydrogenase subunit 5 [Gruberia lanceolata]